MTAENVEIALGAFHAWNEGEMEQLAELCHPGVVLHAPPGWPEPGPFEGRDAVIGQFREIRGTFARDSIELLGETHAKGDRVIFRFDWRVIGLGPKSDVEVTCVMTVREGQIHDLAYFWDHAEAMKAAGVSDPGRSDAPEP